jgi:hypothetical protein
MKSNGATGRRAVYRRLLEINEAFHRLALDPVDSEVVRREGELYGEAVCLLQQLDLDPSKYLPRRLGNANR